MSKRSELFDQIVGKVVSGVELSHGGLRAIYFTDRTRLEVSATTEVDNGEDIYGN